MATSTPSVDRDMGVGGILSTGLAVATDDLRISGLQLAASFAALVPVPLVGALIQAVLAGLAIQFADETLGNPDPEQSFLIRAASVILTALVVGITVVIGLVLLILPGVFLALKFSLAIPAVWIGDNGPIEALGESWSRTSGHLGTIFGVGLVFLVLLLLVFGPAFYVFAPLESAAALRAFAQRPLIVASPPLFAISVLYSVTVGAVAIATQAVMFRSFGTPDLTAGPDDVETEF